MEKEENPVSEIFKEFSDRPDFLFAGLRMRTG